MFGCSGLKDAKFSPAARFEIQKILPAARFNAKIFRLRRASTPQILACGALHTPKFPASARFPTENFACGALQTSKFSPAAPLNTKNFRLRRASTPQILACGALKMPKFSPAARFTTENFAHTCRVFRILGLEI